MHVDRLKTLWPEIEPLLDQLLDLDEPERAPMLERLAAGSPETRRVLESLLRADREAAEGFAHPVIPREALGAIDSAASVESGARIGPYVVRRELGRGGMGTVVLAERDDGQFEQRVAIKVVRSDAWAPGARERFVQERRILARLQHPNIARLLDGGVLADGAPFLVMEYVEGLPISAWCDERRLGVRARVELFRQVCEAVEYAHRQLVVHRDLKPENILVTDRGEVKLLDFGIAKLLEPTGLAALPGTQAVILTPGYAAPEQYLGSALTVATDEYQLGLVLYELLTGQRAHGETTGSPLAHQRRVLDVDPERPSRRVTRSVTGAPPAAETVAPDRISAATARGTTVAGLAHELAGDLDAIVLKALEREPEHRYPSVEALHRDLDDMLADRPVAARRATTGYRLRKYARRHRVAVAATALVFLSLAGGLIGVLVQARIAAHERDLARESERKAAAINDFVLRELLESPTPERTLGRPLTVAEVLAGASRTVGHAFTGDPETEAAVRMTLARSYQALGKLDSARGHAEAAERLLAARLPPGARDRMEARALLGSVALDQGHYDDAQTILDGVATDRARVLGPTDPATLASQRDLARVLEARGQTVRADSMFAHALAALPPPGDQPWRLAVDLRVSRAAALVELGRPALAESLLRQALTIEHRHLGPDHPAIVATLRSLAAALNKDLRPIEAGKVLSDVLSMSLRLYGPDHPATADAYMALAISLDMQLRHADALDAVTHAVAIYRRTLGDEHPKTLRALRNEAVLLDGEQRYREAGPVYEEVYRTCVKTLGPEHPQTIEALSGLQILRLQEHRLDEARSIARRIIATYEHAVARPDVDPELLADYSQFLIGVDPSDVRDPARAVVVARRSVEATRRQDWYALRALGFAQDAAGDWRAAIASLKAALALPDGVRSWTTEDKLVELLEKHGAPGEEEQFLLAHLADERRLRGPDDRYAGKTLRLLSRYYHRVGRDDEAERYARDTITQLLKSLPDGHWEVGRARGELGGLLVARHVYGGETESLLVKGFHALEADPEVAEKDLETVRHDLVRLYRATDRPDDALAWSERKFAPRAPVEP
ncbi:MAG: tetratricopeptide repeat protein [Candidatus Eisenbacteria bacterium]